MSGPIAILGGTGEAGMGLALRWTRAGREVIIGSRSAERAEQAAAEIRRKAGADAKVSGEESAVACSRSSLLALTVPFEGHAEFLKSIKPSFQPDAVLIDVTVPLASSVGGRSSRYLGVWQGSAAQQAAELVPRGVTVAAAFQNCSAEIMYGDGPVECDVIVCCDDPSTTKLVSDLVVSIPGLRAIDGGKLENARIVEQLTALLIGLSIRHKGHCGVRITGLPESAFRTA